MEDNVKYLTDQTNTTVCTSQGYISCNIRDDRIPFEKITPMLWQIERVRKVTHLHQMEGIKVLSEQDVGNQNGSVLHTKAIVRELYE